MRYKDYILEPDKDRFNIYFEKIIEEGENKGKITKQTIGYSFRIEEAIKTIAILETNKSNPETLHEWLKEFRIIVYHIKSWTEVK